jgi:hypothetical protein
MKVWILELRIKFWAAVERRAFAKRHALMIKLWTIRPPFRHE